MTPFGHAAFAYLAFAPRLRRAASRAPFYAIGGALLPDVVDKSLMIAGAFPWGRTVGHSAAAWGAILAVVYLWHLAAQPIPRVVWVTWGAISHLVADLIDDFSAGFESLAYAFSAWFGFPWTNPDMYPWIVQPGFATPRDVSAFEVACIGLCIIYIVWRRREEYLST